MRALLALLALAACDRTASTATTPGARLEAAAVARGLVPDPDAPLTGSWASDTDRLCIVPAGKDMRVGVSVDYGPGQGCAASGTLDRKGNRLEMRFGDCRFDAAFDGERIAFPAELPAACDRSCTGRATLTALSVERLSDSATEAEMVRGPGGRLLCGG